MNNDNSNKNSQNPKFSHLDMETTNAASATDFTGLIPSNMNSEQTPEAYMDIHNFGTKARNARSAERRIGLM